MTDGLAIPKFLKLSATKRAKAWKSKDNAAWLKRMAAGGKEPEEAEETVNEGLLRVEQEQEALKKAKQARRLAVLKERREMSKLKIVPLKYWRYNASTGKYVDDRPRLTRRYNAALKEICNFLGKPVPEASLINLNDIKRRRRSRTRKASTVSKAELMPKVLELSKKGLSQSKIGFKLGISRSLVWQILKDAKGSKS